MKALGVLVAAALLSSAASAQGPEAASGTTSLPEVKRVYVAALVGTEAEALRELIIASLDATKLFILTDNADRADAILKGAADDHVFTDTHDMEEGIGARQNGGKSTSGTITKAGGVYAGSRFRKTRRTTRKNGNTRPMRASDCAARMEMCSGRQRKRARELNSRERARTWRRKLPANLRSIWKKRGMARPRLQATGKLRST